MTEDHTPSRRSVLKATGGAFAATAPAIGASGLAAAAPGDVVEVNVGFSPGGDLGAAKSAADSVVRELDAIGVVTIRAPERAVKALRGRPDVEFVEENGTVHALAQTLPWGIDRIDADISASAGFTGDGAHVAIIDTGIDSDHPDLQANLGQGRAFVPCDTSGGGCPSNNRCHEPWDDDNGHGTHCAGIAAAIHNAIGVVGVAPRTTLHAVKVFGCTGSGSFSDVAAGIVWAADNGHDVANMSFGAASGSSTVDRAINRATNAGVTLVAGVGNGGPCTNCVAYPARHPDVVAVSASNCSDDLADFSGQGPEVDLIAPGANVLSTVPGGYATFPGTSATAPHVAGAAGVLAAQGQSRSQIISRLTSTAEDLGLTSNEQGAGLVDVAAAVGEPSTDDGFGNSGNC